MHYLSLIPPPILDLFDFLLEVLSSSTTIKSLLTQLNPSYRLSPFYHIDQSFSHLLQVITQKFPLLASRRQVDFEDIGTIVLINQYIKPVYLEATLFLYNIRLATVQGLHNVCIKFSFYVCPFIPYLL